MRVGKWQFHPGLWPTVVTIVFLPLLIVLGFWQLHRADYKRGLLQQYARVTEVAPVSLNAALADGRLAALPRYQHVRARGRYESGQQVLLQNMQNGDQVGYEVLTPLVLEPGGQVVMVNRGFVARTPGVEVLPDIAVGSGTRAVTGILGILPVPGIRVGKIIVAAGWPKVILYPTHATLAGLYGPQLLGPVLQLDASQPDGFVRDWKPSIGFPPVRHDAYAMQWFALALALVIIWIVVNSKRINTDG